MCYLGHLYKGRSQKTGKCVTFPFWGWGVVRFPNPSSQAKTLSSEISLLLKAYQVIFGKPKSFWGAKACFTIGEVISDQFDHLKFFLVLGIWVHIPGNGKQDQVEIFCTRGCWGGTYCHRNKYSKIIRRVIHSHHTRHNTTQKVNIFVTTKTFLKCKINHDFFTNKGFPKVFLWKREHSNILNIYWIYWRWIWRDVITNDNEMHVNMYFIIICNNNSLNSSSMASPAFQLRIQSCKKELIIFICCLFTSKLITIGEIKLTSPSLV